MSSDLKVESPTELTVVFGNGYKAGKLYRRPTDRDSPKQYCWVMSPVPFIGSKALRELADLLDEKNAAEPLRPGVNEQVRDY